MFMLAGFPKFYLGRVKAIFDQFMLWIDQCPRPNGFV